MKLQDKIATLFRTKLSPSSRPGARSVPSRRPTPIEDGSLPLDPRYAWGFALEPADKMRLLLNEFIEQLALEAYLNGPGFEFTHQELEPRFLAFFDRLTQEGELQRLDNAPLEPGRPVVGPKRWIEAQQIRISRLAQWWRLQGGPDVEAKVL